jgi:EmrB/QacA subfamily drug resistance transporter
MVVLPGLLLAIMLAMLDNMIVGTALPKIVGDLGGLEHFSWVVTAYVLGTTVSTPLWGKIGDLYGRKGIFLTSIVVFLVGSALSGMSQTMGELIGFRALQGLGAGGLLVGAMAIIGDLVPPRERGRYQGIMAGIMALAMIAGPLAGGFITDNLNWRWAFYVNLPLGVIALVLLVTRLHLPKYHTEHRIDWVGAGLLSVGITALVLLTTWAGRDYAWGSWQIISLGALGVATLVVFVLVERRAVEPILPLNLFRNRNFTLVSIIGFLLGFSMFGAINLLPLYQQTVQGASATNSGLLLIPMMLGMMVVSVFAGQVITKTGRYKIFPIVGGIGMTVGMVLLAQLDVDTTKLMLALFMVVFGMGMGFLMQTSMLIAQNSVEQKDLGVASSSATFFRSIGGSFGVSLFGTIFVRALESDLAKQLGTAAAGKLTSGGGQFDPTKLAATPDAIRLPVYHGIATGLSEVFVWAIPFAAVVAVLAFFIKEIPLRGEPAAAPVDGESTKVPSTLVAAME